MDILITEDLHGDALDALAQRFDVLEDETLWGDRERLAKCIADARAVIVRNRTQVHAELLGAAGKLQVIGRCGAGLDNVDVRAASDLGIVVTAAPEENSVSVAEFVMSLILSLARQIPAADRSTRGGSWNRLGFAACELFRKTLGLVGLGKIGMRVALRARAFQMNILAYDPFLTPVRAAVTETDATLVDREELLKQSDFVSIHLPLSDATRHSFDRRAFALMKPTAYLINSSRGAIIDEAALVEALEKREIAGAALDVRAEEPPVCGRLEEMDNVILTPHFAGLTEEAQDRVTAAVARDVAAVLDGEGALNFVNFPAPER